MWFEKTYIDGAQFACKIDTIMTIFDILIFKSIFSQNLTRLKMYFTLQLFWNYQNFWFSTICKFFILFTRVMFSIHLLELELWIVFEASAYYRSTSLPADVEVILHTMKSLLLFFVCLIVSMSALSPSIILHLSVCYKYQ